MTYKEFVKLLKVGTHFKLTFTCIRDENMGMKKGDSYSEDCKVYSIKRSRRQWEESDKLICVEAIGNGYFDLSVNAFKTASIEQKEGFIRVIYADTASDNSNIHNDFYFD